MIQKNEAKDQLFTALLKLRTIEECYEFFDDLCTIKEIDSMAQRLESAIFIYQNKTYEHIINKTDISSATLSRVSKCFHYGSGGYRKIIERLDYKNTHLE